MLSNLKYSFSENVTARLQLGHTLQAWMYTKAVAIKHLEQTARFIEHCFGCKAVPNKVFPTSLSSSFAWGALNCTE